MRNIIVFKLGTAPIAAIMKMVGGAAGGGGGGGGGSSSGGAKGAISGMQQKSGALTGLLTGIGQGISGAIKQKKADASFPSFADPNETALLSDVQRKKNSLNSGSMYSSAKNKMENAVAGNTAAAANLAGSGGNSVKALIDSSNTIDEGFNNLLGTQEQASQFYYGLDDKLTEKGADRQLQLQMVRNRDLQAQAASKKKMAGEMVSGSLVSIASGGQTGTPTGASPGNSNQANPAAVAPVIGGFTPGVNSPAGGSTSAGYQVGSGGADSGKGGAKKTKSTSAPGGSSRGSLISMQ